MYYLTILNVPKRRMERNSAKSTIFASSQEANKQNECSINKSISNPIDYTEWIGHPNLQGWPRDQSKGPVYVCATAKVGLDISWSWKFRFFLLIKCCAPFFPNKNCETVNILLRFNQRSLIIASEQIEIQIHLLISILIGI